jgi:hypothetical protein
MQYTVFGMLLAVVVLTSSAGAQGLVIIQGSDGTNGRVIDLGNGFGIYSDSHGNSGTVIGLSGGPQPLPLNPPSAQSGTGQGLGSVPEPITPAPVLPFGPRASPLLTPGSPKVPAVESPSSSGPGTGFWKR